MKLWDKGIKINELIESFTIGKDREMDLHLARFDVIGSLAHIQMLEHVGLLTAEELLVLSKELKEIHQKIGDGRFSIEDGIEDIHSQIEHMLTLKLGETGKKIHSGRSRNDQVLLDLKLFTRHAIQTVTENTKALFELLVEQSES